MTRSNFLSDEEFWFAGWLLEMQSIGLIDSWSYEPESFVLADEAKTTWTKQLKTKTKTIDKVISQEIKYTPDFQINWNENANGLIFYTPFRPYTQEEKARCPFFVNNEALVSFIEIKPDFDYRNMTRYASTKKHWVMSKYGIIVDTIKIPSFFRKKAFAPEIYLTTPTGKDRCKGRGKKGIPLRQLMSTKQEWHDRIQS